MAAGLADHLWSMNEWFSMPAVRRCEATRREFAWMLFFKAMMTPSILFGSDRCLVTQ